MKCLNCEAEMEKGTVQAFSLSNETWNEFTSEAEESKKGLAGFLRETITVPLTMEKQIAWHCPKCKRVLMWVESEE